MKKYLRIFETEQDYENATLENPSVSFIEELGEVAYDYRILSSFIQLSNLDRNGEPGTVINMKGELAVGMPVLDASGNEVSSVRKVETFETHQMFLINNNSGQFQSTDITFAKGGEYYYNIIK